MVDKERQCLQSMAEGSKMTEDQHLALPMQKQNTVTPSYQLHLKTVKLLE